MDKTNNRDKDDCKKAPKDNKDIMTSETMASTLNQSVEVVALVQEKTIGEDETPSPPEKRAVDQPALESKAKEAEEKSAKQDALETAMNSKAKQLAHEAAMYRGMESPKANQPMMTTPARTPTITIKNQEEFAREWQIRYTELSQYQSQHGHCSILNVSCDNESIHLLRRLCRWMIEQRQLRGEGLLSRARFDLLNLLDFDWSRKAHNDDLWMQSFFTLIDYKNKYGHCNVPQKKVQQYQQLGRWVKKQREEAKRNALRADRVQKLNDIEFTWSFPTARSQLERLTNGSCNEDASTADAAPSSNVTENANMYLGAANNESSLQQDHERLASQEDQLRNYLEESNKRRLRMQQQLHQAPSKKQRMLAEKVIVIDDEDIEQDNDNEQVDDEEAEVTSSAWHHEDDTILGELYHAQYQLYHAQSQMHHAQSRVDTLKEKLATRMQSRSSSVLRRGGQYYDSTTKHCLQDELRKQKRYKKQILRLELQRQRYETSSSSSAGTANAAAVLLDERNRQVQQWLKEHQQPDQTGVSPRPIHQAIVQQKPPPPPAQKATQTSSRDGGVESTSLAQDVSV
jgi:Helicase associated domain